MLPCMHSKGKLLVLLQVASLCMHTSRDTSSVYWSSQHRQFTTHSRSSRETSEARESHQMVGWSHSESLEYWPEDCQIQRHMRRHDFSNSNQLIYSHPIVKMVCMLFYWYTIQQYRSTDSIEIQIVQILDNSMIETKTQSLAHRLFVNSCRNGSPIYKWETTGKLRASTMRPLNTLSPFPKHLGWQPEHERKKKRNVNQLAFVGGRSQRTLQQPFDRFHES